MKNIKIFAIMPIIFPFFFLSVNCYADMMGYAVTNENDSKIYLVNATTGDATLIGSTQRSLVRALEFSPIDGKLYGLAPQGYPSEKNDFYLINTGNGYATLIAEIESPSGHELQVQNLAFDANGALYAIVDWVSLVRLNVKTGEIEDYHSFSIGGLPWAFAIDPISGKGIIWNDSDKALYEINLSNGDTTFLGYLEAHFNGSVVDPPWDASLSALDFTWHGVLYAWDYNNRVFEIDLENLVATYIEDLSISPSCYGFALKSIPCPNRPEGDLNGDCRVDFHDIAVIANHWLECGLDPPDTCWEQKIWVLKKQLMK